MLKAFFHWSDTHPASYWFIAGVPTLVWLGWIAWGLWREPGRIARPRLERALFAALLFGVLFAWRWPFLLEAQELGNPDESQLIAGAITLTHDPVFFRSVDGTTSGPLNFYALLPTHFLGVPLDYFNARLTGLLLLWGGLLATQALLASVYGTALARLGLVPGLLFLASAIDGDLIHYSSEHVSLCLIPLGWWLLWRHRTFGPATRPTAGWLGAAFAAGLLPWAKLQSSLFAAALMVWAAWLLWRNGSLSWPQRARCFGWMTGAAALPSALAFAGIAATGQFEHFYRSYILENVSFVEGVDFPIVGIVRHLAFICSFSGHVPVFLGVMVALIVGGGLGFAALRLRPGAFWHLGLFLTVVAIATVLAPRRAHQHYLLYLVLPLTVWVGATVAECWLRPPSAHRAAARRTLVLGLLVVVQVLAGWRVSLGSPTPYGSLLEDWRNPYAEAARIIREHARPGDAIAMWGWQPWLFVETGLPHGTRDSHTKSQIESAHQKEYFLRRFIADMERNRPTFFVDAVGHGDRSFAYHDRRRQGHEAYPEIVDHLHGRYGSLAEIGPLRIFMRFSRHPLTAHTHPESD